MWGVSSWRPELLRAAPVRVAAAPPQRVSGLEVGQTAFATPTAGWALVGGLFGRRSERRLLYTADAGASWTPQLSWQGSLVGRVTAFDAERAGLVLGLPEQASEVNGQPVGDGSGPVAIFAGTEDGGATWTLGREPRPRQFSGMFHFLSPRQLWIMIAPPFRYPQKDIARTADGGATWATMQAPGDLPVSLVAFSTLTDGVLVAVDQRHADILWATSDGGDTWTRTPLPPPPVPEYAMTWLTPVVRPGRSMLLLLRAERYSQKPAKWAGTHAYYGGGQTWSGPYRLPMTHTGLDFAVVGGDGRFWAASGHNLWVADDLAGRWRHQTVPLHGEQLRGVARDPALAPALTTEVIADIAPVGDGVIWLTTTHGTALGDIPSGRLFRSEDDGEHWTELTVESA